MSDSLPVPAVVKDEVLGTSEVAPVGGIRGFISGAMENKYVKHKTTAFVADHSQSVFLRRRRPDGTSLPPPPIPHTH